MANKPNRDKRAEKLRREQEALNRVFTLFLVGLAAECYLLLLYNKFAHGMVQEIATFSYVLEYAVYAGLAAVIVGIVLTVWKWKEPTRQIGLWVLGIGAFFALTSKLSLEIYPKGTDFLCVLVPILTVLGLVYCLFQRECFFNVTVLSGAIFTLWLCRRGLGTLNWNTKVTVGGIVVLIGLAAAGALLWYLRKENGQWHGFQIFAKDCDYRVIFATLAVAFAAILLALLLPATAFYTMWILGIALFGLAVYYTTKLM